MEDLKQQTEKRLRKRKIAAENGQRKQNGSSFEKVHNWTFPTLLPIKTQLQNIQIVRSLDETGMCVLDNFLDHETSRHIAETTKSLYSNHPALFHSATSRNVKEPNGDVTTMQCLEFRSDKICWISGNEALFMVYSKLRRAFEKFLWTLTNEYRSCSRGKAFKISHKSKIQVSCFPAGSYGYKPHVDNPNGDFRLLTLVYYPNDVYDQSQYGGCTRFFLKNKEKFVDIEPIANRIVAHWSDSRVVKEILPCRADIFSLTVWYFGQTE